MEEPRAFFRNRSPTYAPDPGGLRSPPSRLQTWQRRLHAHTAEVDPRQSRVVELRFFAGLSLEETSEVMGIATATVQRDWTAARAWLHREISRRPRT